MYVHPQGMEKTVTYIKDRYNNIPMFITENGEYYRVRIAHEFNYSYDNNNAAIPLLVPLIMRFNFICPAYRTWDE